MKNTRKHSPKPAKKFVGVDLGHLLLLRAILRSK